MSGSEKAAAVFMAVGTMIFGGGMSMTVACDESLMNTGLVVAAAGAVIVIICTILHSGLKRRKTND